MANQGKVDNDGSIIIDKNEIDSITFDTTINEGKSLVDEKANSFKEKWNNLEQVVKDNLEEKIKAILKDRKAKQDSADTLFNGKFSFQTFDYSSDMIDAYMHLAQRDEDKIDVFSDKFDTLRGDDGIVKKNDLGEAYNVFRKQRTIIYCI